jgi:hypothetical protein
MLYLPWGILSDRQRSMDHEQCLLQISHLAYSGQWWMRSIYSYGRTQTTLQLIDIAGGFATRPSTDDLWGPNAELD